MKNKLGLEGDLFLVGLLAYCKITKGKAVSSPPSFLALPLSRFCSIPNLSHGQIYLS